KHIVDRIPLNPDVEDFSTVAAAAAGLARDEHVGEKHHLDLHVPGALTDLAPSARQIERECGRAVLALPGERLGREELPDLVECLDVGDWIGTGRTSNRRLVHQEHILQRFPSAE